MSAETKVQMLNGPYCSYNCRRVMRRDSHKCYLCHFFIVDFRLRSRHDAALENRWMCLACFCCREPLLSVDQIVDLPQLSQTDQTTIRSRLYNDRLFEELYRKSDQHRFLSPTVVEQRRIECANVFITWLPKELIELIIESFYDHVELTPGKMLCCLDSRTTWLNAFVMQVTDSHIHVTYDGYLHDYDEWIEYYPRNLRLQEVPVD